MRAIISYMVESAAYMALFYTFYQLFLSRDTRFAANRIYLVSTLLLSSMLPLVSFRSALASRPAIAGFRDIVGGIVVLDPVTVTPSGDAGLSTWADWLLTAVYIAGLVVAMAILIYNLYSLRRTFTGGGKRGSNVVYLDEPASSGFSTFGIIFLPRGLEPEEEERIRRHEELHIRHHHFADILLIRILSVVQWFNPFIYLYERSLRAIHEFEVDSEMISEGESLLSYQSLIINQVFRTRIFSIPNAFAGKTLLKKRIIMMTKNRSGRYAWAKLLMLVPAFVLLFVLFSCKSEQNTDPAESPGQDTEQVSLDQATEPSETKSEALSQEPEIKDLRTDPDVFVVVEEMPTFMGGDINTFRSWIVKNVKYPPQAYENGIQGQVFVLFVVGEDGLVSRATIQRGVDPILDQEALRVISSSPPWEPGKHEGKTVPVKISVTVNFKLS